MPEPMVYLRDRLVPRAQASVSIRDRSFRFGEAAFETLRARGESVFQSAAHLERLGASAQAFGWELPWSPETLDALLRRTLQANALAESRIRIQAGPGAGELDTVDGEPLLLIEAIRFQPLPAESRSNGVALAVATPRRSIDAALAGAKTAAYLENLIARRRARQEGAHDALILNAREEVCESSCANLFTVSGGSVHTPELTCGVLAGVTRRVVLELAASSGRPVEQTVLTLRDVLQAEELFLTSTVVEVLPVVSVQGQAIGGGTPGPVATELNRLYRERMDREIGTLR